VPGTACGYWHVRRPSRTGCTGLYLEPDEIVAIARQGAELGCKEALFTLGDKPEDRWRQAREWLDEHGYDDTLSYVRAMGDPRPWRRPGLLPHPEPRGAVLGRTSSGSSRSPRPWA